MRTCCAQGSAMGVSTYKSDDVRRRAVALHSSREGSLPMAPTECKPGHPIQRPVGQSGTFAVNGVASAVEQPGKVQHGPSSLLQGRSGNPGPLQAAGKSHLSKILGRKTTEIQGKILHDTASWLFLGSRFSIAGLQRSQSREYTTTNQGTDMIQGALEAIKHGSFTLSGVVQAFVQGLLSLQERTKNTWSLMYLKVCQATLKPMHQWMYTA